MRPFLLRRTKTQVLSDLPEKTEQTIVCDLERPQRALYNELRDHYRRALLGAGSTWQRSKIQVLEALLRVARRLGCRTLAGGGMAVFQAVEAFRLFTGIIPDAARMLRHFDSMNAGADLSSTNHTAKGG